MFVGAIPLCSRTADVMLDLFAIAHTRAVVSSSAVAGQSAVSCDLNSVDPLMLAL